MRIRGRIDRLNEKANLHLRKKKSDIVVLIAPSNNKKGWSVDICNDHKTGDEDTELRQRLEDCNTFDELTEKLDGYATNVPNVRRSNEYQQ